MNTIRHGLHNCKSKYIEPTEKTDESDVDLIAAMLADLTFDAPVEEIGGDPLTAAEFDLLDDLTRRSAEPFETHALSKSATHPGTGNPHSGDEKKIDGPKVAIGSPVYKQNHLNHHYQHILDQIEHIPTSLSTDTKLKAHKKFAPPPVAPISPSLAPRSTRYRNTQAKAAKVLADLRRLRATGSRPIIIPIPGTVALDPAPLVSPSAPWAVLTPDQVFIAASREAQSQGGQAFTLNFPADRQAVIIASVNPVRLVSGWINRQLGKLSGAFGYAFRLEVCHRTGKLHSHGVITFDPATDQDALRAALRAAGGRFGDNGASTQLRMKRITSADGWVGYSSKHLDRVAAQAVLPGKHLSFVSRDLLRLAKERHEAGRVIKTRKPRTTPAPVTPAPTPVKAPTPRPVREMVRVSPYKTHPRVSGPSGTLTHPGKPKPAYGAYMRRLPDHLPRDHRSTPVMPP